MFALAFFKCIYLCSKTLQKDTVDLCLSFTSAGMPERDSFPVASENKSDSFRSNSGQMHLLRAFLIIWSKSKRYLPRQDMF